MPKGKKKFIDRKNAVTFHLVHRSQQDPLVADETAPQHVLLPVATEKKSEGDVKKRKDEQRKFGVFFDDDYNYLQHLRDASEMGVDWEAVPRHGSKVEQPSFYGGHQDHVPVKDQKIKLPSSVFASEVEEDVGLLNKAAPRSGLCLDLDPDIVAAMDEDFDYDDPDNILEDNFIELANAEGQDDDDEYEDLSSNADTGSGCEADYDDEEDDDVRSLPGSEYTFGQEETKSRFTNYSMSSSVMRRNEQLSLLDMRFERLYEDYDDNEIGALDCEEIEGNVAPDSELIMQYANEFEQQKTAKLHEADKTLTLVENMDSDSQDSEMDVIEVSNNQEKWDCESILSTYSNLYNHPKLITEPQPAGRIQVSGRTGIPLNVLDGNKLTAKALAKLDSTNATDDKHGRAESVISMLSVLSVRPKNESPEEKKDRKRALKEYRKERRIERKANTLAFKEEKKRQEKVMLNVKSNLQGVKIV